MGTTETTALADAESPRSSATDATSRTLLQTRLALYAKVLILVYLGYWPAFILIWGMDPSIGYSAAARYALSPATLVLGSVQVAFWLAVRGRARTTAALRAIDVTGNALIGVTFGIIAFRHPEPGISVFEGLLALNLVLGARAVLVPSSARRTALVGGLAVLGPVTVMMLYSSHFALPQLGAPTLVSMFVLWAVVGVALSTVASAVLYGLRREVQAARQLGQYTLGEKLGEGGMGEVFRAQHALLKRPTAIKLLSKTTAMDGLARFEREAQLTAQLTHPSSVVVHDYGRTSDGILYYAMEYLDGIDLEQLMEIDGSQPAARVIHILRQVCGSLSEAHGLGLIHRDIKPANLYLVRRSHDPDFVKVLDFGLVKDLGGSAIGLTGMGGRLGTPLYMSPEAVAAPSGLDARSDLYSVGATAYRLLTGSPVFEGSTPVEVWGHTVHSKPVPPSERLRASVPADLEAVVLRCLAKAPADRYATADELIAALDACGDARAWTADRARAWWAARETAIARRRTGKRGAATLLGSEVRIGVTTGSVQ
jgi:hypothetical protein